MKILNSKLSLGAKFIILVVIVISTMLTIISYLFISHDSEAHYHYFKQRAQLLAEIVSVVAPEEILSNDHFTLNETVKNLSGRDVVILCAIKDKYGRYITNYFDKFNPYISEAIKTNNSENLKDIVASVKKMTHVYIVNRKIVYDGEDLGEVELMVSTLELYSDVKYTILMEVVISLAIILILSVSISTIFKRAALNRIDDLISCAESVSQGDLGRSVKVDNDDELGRLGASFNKMVRRLKSSIGLKEQALLEFSELNRTLEFKVEARMLELNSMNQELSLKQMELEQHRDNLQGLIDEKTEDLVDAKNLAESANRAKSEFLENMSHELRTPLHAILSFSKMGIKKVNSISPAKTLEYFTKIEKSGDRLLLLLNDLLDLSKLESGKQILEFDRYYMSEIAVDIVGEFDDILKEKNILLDVVINGNESEVFCDKAKISQVVCNLVSNAIKFSGFGETISITISDEQSFVRFQIEDDGVGVPEDELDEVFNKFIQSSKTKTGAGGTGLGLPISKEIILLHKGSIAAGLGKNGGAVFWFT
ncbi:MAG: ATP-binding protein, partial [Candidatus Peregrinibacteria bacterium]|nr:ATP-binding protein [Candidatus Peregrinibacteria bacterium]